jgi:hypothetical protein
MDNQITIHVHGEQKKKKKKERETDSPRLAAAKRGLLPWARAISLAGWPKQEIFEINFKYTFETNFWPARLPPSQATG